MPPQPPLPTKMRWLAAFRQFLKQSTKPKDVVRFVGEDHLGNRYYESEQADGYRKYKRFYDRKVKSDDITDVVDLTQVPSTWHAWLRFTRKDPPSDLEVKESEDYFKYQQALANSKQASAGTTQDSRAHKDTKRPFPKIDPDG